MDKTAQLGKVDQFSVMTVLSPACLETNTNNECALESVVILSQLGIWFAKRKKKEIFDTIKQDLASKVSTKQHYFYLFIKMRS